METRGYDSQAMRSFSRSVFGNEHRLAVALAILKVGREEPAALYMGRLAKLLEITDKEVEKHVLDFLTVGLLERDPDPPTPAGRRGRGRPPNVFRLREDHFWGCLSELGERFRRVPPAG